MMLAKTMKLLADAGNDRTFQGDDVRALR